jgi:CLIP-associating protein 1/2
LEDAALLIDGTDYSRRNAPGHAKADLKKQLILRDIRKSIATYIMLQLGISSDTVEATSSTQSRPIELASSTQSRPKPQFSQSMSAVEMPPSSQTEPEQEQMDPLDVYSKHELEDIFSAMHPSFEGRESEQNWLAREKNCTKLRRMTRGNAPTEYQLLFLAGIKALLDGILKAVNSLRTTLSSRGCLTIQDLARICGPGIDPMVEILMQNLVKLCGGTKKIASQNGNVTVACILAHTSYHHRILQHLWAACQDKNVQPRTYCTTWLKTVLEKHSNQKSHIEHTGGLELIEKALKRGLADANADVRVGMRGTYWVFARTWPARAEA